MVNPLRYAFGLAGKAWGYVLLIRVEKRKLRAAQDAVARELRFNGRIATRYEKGDAPIQSARDEIVLAAWEVHRDTLHYIASRGHSGLWKELCDHNEALAETRSRGASPSAGYRGDILADQLEGIDL